VASSLQGLRKHIERLGAAKALKVLAERGNVVVSGKSGSDILQYYNKALENAM
jgi:hypothetical protein